jgi:hypothetical protein
MRRVVAEGEAPEFGILHGPSIHMKHQADSSDIVSSSRFRSKWMGRIESSTNLRIEIQSRDRRESVLHI